MKSMRSMMVALVAVGALLGGSAFGDDYAMLINVNFEYNDEVMSGAAGTGEAGDAWNNLPAESTAFYKNLLDRNGVQRGIGIEKDAWKKGQCNNVGGASELFKGYVSGDYNAGEPWHELNLSGLDPRRTYDLYLYSGWDWNNNSASFRVGGVGKQAAEDNTEISSYIENTNYVVYTAISPNPDGTLDIEFEEYASPISGFQLGLRPDGYAKIVNVNFSNTNYVEVMTGAAGAGVDDDVWNVVVNNSTNLHSGLLDNNGYGTSVAMQKSSYWGGSCWGGSGDANALFRSYDNADDHPSNVVWHALDLSGLDPEKSYDLFLYSGWNWATNTETFRVGGVEKQPAEDNMHVLSPVENVNYVVYTNISSDANGDLLVEYKNNPAAFNGFQICTFDPDVLEIVDIAGVSGQDLLKITVDAPPPASNYHPESTMDLVAGGWTNVPHSDAVGNPFYTTNLGYSSGSNLTVEIYVQGTNSAEFFKIVGE